MSGLGFYCLFFTVRIHRPFQGHHAVLGNYLDVVGVCGQGLILHQRTPDLLHKLAIGGIFFLAVDWKEGPPEGGNPNVGSVSSPDTTRKA